MQGRPAGDLVFKSESDRDWMRSRGTGVQQRNLHVLLIEDDPEDVMLVERSLGKPSDASHPFRLEHSFALQEGLARLGEGHDKNYPRRISKRYTDVHVQGRP